LKKILLLTNSRAVTPEVHESLNAVTLGNELVPVVHAARFSGIQEVLVGVNRKHAAHVTAEIAVPLVQADIYCNIFDFPQILKSYRRLSKLVTTEKIDTIHCNTPIGGVIGRLLGKFHKNIKTVLYTAHGFHFYEGAPLVNQLIYKNIERYLARYTDCLLTMNEEDFRSAQSLPLRQHGTVHKVSGVGIDLPQIAPFSAKKRQALRAEFGIPKDALLFIYVGDLIARKNVETAIQAIARIQQPTVHFLICGEGDSRAKLEKMAGDQVHFAGFRKDIPDLLQISDCLLFPTFQEGLPRAVMEAMAYQLPCVVSNVRGNLDLIDKKGGFLVDPHSVVQFTEALTQVVALNEQGRLKKLGLYNRKKVAQFSVDVVQAELKEIYQARQQFERYGTGRLDG
jgi:glycosyltransferase involved in cell wall biosynthesis